MNYNPFLNEDRRELATKTVAMLIGAGFSKKDGNPDHEDIYTRTRFEAPNGPIEVIVYTTIVKGEVRTLGQDAMRVCLTYKNKGLAKQRRVNRTGDINAIVDRLKGRMRDAWSALKQTEQCYQCGAPKAISKVGKSYCADICWNNKG